MAKAKKDNRGRGEKIVTPVGRVSYPHISKPHITGQYADEKYKLTLLFDKEKADELKAMKLNALATARQMWPDIKFSELEHPFKDGDEKADDNQEYAGKIMLTMKSTRKPGVVGPDREQLADGDDIYGGCFARASGHFYTYQNTRETVIVENGRRRKRKEEVQGVSFSLENVQKVADGERFGGGGGPAEDDFDEVDTKKLGLDDMDENESFEDEVEEKKPASKGKAKPVKEEIDEAVDSVDDDDIV